jgi:hypothetical protein
LHPERAPGPAVTPAWVSTRKAEARATLEAMLKWARTLKDLPTTDMAYGEYAARKATRLADELRAYNASVISSRKEMRSVLDSTTTIPLYRNEQRSREVWIGGFVPKWGKAGKRTENYTVSVQYGSRTDETWHEEERTIETLGSGTTVPGPWRNVRTWTASK